MSSEMIINQQGSPSEVEGFLVGHAQDPAGPTGCSLVLCPQGAVGGVHMAGSATGTRQMDGLQPWHLVPLVHGVLFTGGSSFGLAAADGASAWLEEQGVGLSMGPIKIPILPTAVIFDLPITGGKIRPGPGMGRAACQAAARGPMSRGNVGAGCGATIGKLFGLAQATKGGLGGASLSVGRLRVGVMAVVNAFGDVLDEEGRIMAGARTAPEAHQFADTTAWFLAGNLRQPGQASHNTTLAVVTTNARLDKSQACKVAAMAHHGLVRTVRPCHTTFDGDLVCVLATGQVEADLNGLGIMASRLLRLAIYDAVRSAEPLAGLPSAAQLTPQLPNFQGGSRD
ncbi:MAG: peptidase S58 family protein [Desulfarculus sp.]|nr:MAG: peptidase S58 family protein [Desulfarculus sp.]